MYKLALILGFVAQAAMAAPSADDVTISMAPASPIVFTAPYTYTDNNGGEVHIDGPWTRMQMTLKNRSSDFVTIRSLTIFIKAPDGSTMIKDFDPRDFNQTLVCQKGVKVPIKYDLFGEFGPMSEGYLQLAYFGAPLPRECEAQNPNILEPIFYIEGLPGAPQVTTPGLIPNYTYEVRVTVEGWFGTFADRHERFEKNIRFITQ